MGRHARHVHELADGRRVGYAPKARGGLFRVQFRHPTDPGKYVEAATGVAVPKNWHAAKPPPPDWFARAVEAIREAYAPTGAASAAPPATWEEVESRLLDAVTREGSRRTYRSALALVRAALPGVAGPAAVTARDAAAFARRYGAGGYRRTKSDAGAVRGRTPQTVRTTLNNLTVLWSRLGRLGLVEGNVWAGVERPQVPKKLPKVPTEEAVGNLFGWLDRRFPGPDGGGWELMRTFVRVKMVAGCRLNDLCQAESAQFDPKAGTLLIRADHDKTHRERLITLPPPLAAALDRLKGGRYLWERYAEDRPVFRPGPRAAAGFTPSVMYHAVQSIFREYGRTHPAHKVKTHDLRKRAITLTVMATGGDIDAATQAIPVTADTARRHYLDARRAYDAAAIQRKTAAVLLGDFGDSGAIVGRPEGVAGE